MSDLIHVSLFSGVGGIDLAADQVGIPTVLACEVDRHARGVLHDRFPTTTLHADVTELTTDDLRAAGAVPERTIVSAGWPCQGNSVAGRREGMADARSGLWSHVVRLLADFRPAWFLGENVPGLLSVNDGRDFGVVLGDLAGLGYGFAWRVLDAQHFGVPQRRRRVVLVGRAGDDGRAPARVLLEPEGSGRDSQTGNEARQDTPAHAARSTRGARIVRTLTTRAGSTFDDQQTDQLVVSTLQAGGGDRGYRIDAEAAAGGHLVPFQRVIRSGARDADGNLPADVWPTRQQAATLSPFDLGSDSRAVELIVHPLAVRGRDGGAQVEVGPEGGPYNALRAGDGGSSRQSLVSITTVTGDRTHALTAEGADASEDGTGRGTPIIAATLTAGVSRPGVSAPGRRQEDDHNLAVTTTAVRRLTPLECERLQGWPDNHTATSWGKPQADSQRYKQAGNGVATPVFAWVLRRIVAEASEVAA